MRRVARRGGIDAVAFADEPVRFVDLRHLPSVRGIENDYIRKLRRAVSLNERKSAAWTQVSVDAGREIPVAVVGRRNGDGGELLAARGIPKPHRLVVAFRDRTLR